MKHFVIFLVVTICLGINLVLAAKNKAVPITDLGSNHWKENASQVLNDKHRNLLIPDPQLIDNIPDMRSIAGSAGKNIVFAEDGQNVAVIYGLFSGDPENIMQTYVAYSTDRGLSWMRYGPLSTFNARRIYSGLDAEQNWPDPNDLRVHFAWHQAARISGSYVASPAFYAKEVVYPDGLITAAFELPYSEDRDVWLPCIAVRDSFTIITAIGSGLCGNYICYIWRSTDYGETWDTGRVFIPFPWDKYGPHFRLGSDGYIFFYWLQMDTANLNIFVPYYCESFDYALTWTEPRPLPYPCSTSGWWSGYDCEVVRDTPVVTTKFVTGNYDYGRIVVYRPDSGGPGNWHFKTTVLIDSDTWPYARCPNLAADDSGNIFVVYNRVFITGEDTVTDCGVFARPAHQDTWYDWGRCTFNGNIGYMEVAHNAPLIANGDSTIIGLIYTDAGSYPNSGGLYFDCIILPNPPIPPWVGDKEKHSALPSQPKILVSPNPAHNLVKFVTSSPITSLQIYDVTGRLVISHPIRVSREGRFDQPQATSHCFIWDGRKHNPGVYFYNLQTDENNYQGKIILTR